MTPGGPAAERYARVQRAMAQRRVGALCLATPHLACFASGARRVRVAGSGGTVPWVVVLAGAPSAVIFTTDPDGAPAWMPRPAVEPLRWDRERQLARIAELVATVRGAVGCDVLAPAFREALGDRTFVDAVPLLAEAAAPRSPAEIGAIADALAAARGALREAATAIMPGTTPAVLSARFAAAMSGSGAGFPLHEGVVRRAGVRLAPGDRLGDGDLVGLDFGLWRGEHAGVAADTVACGGRPLSARRRAWSEALCAVAARCRDGAPSGELRAAAVRAGAGQGSLLAHGLGVGIEPPLVDLEDDDDLPLRAGTVLVLAPVVGGFHASRALLVTESSHRWLEAVP